MNKYPDDFQYTLDVLNNSKVDSSTTYNENYAKNLTKIQEDFVVRNVLLTSLLSNYITQREKRVKTNHTFKNIIFWVFIAILCIMVITTAIVAIVALRRDSVKNIVALISVLLTFLSSLIIIFEIISKYLFPADEEKDTIEMIRTVIENDIKLQEYLSSAQNDSKNINYVVGLYKNNVIEKDDFISILSYMFTKNDIKDKNNKK